MRYLDLDIQVASDGRGGYKVLLPRSLYGRAEAELVPPFSADIIRDGLLAELEMRVRGSGGEVPEREERAGRHFLLEDDPAPLSDIESLGDALFESLIAGQVRDRLDRSLSYLEGRGKKEGLRLRLYFNPLDREVAPLAALPWVI
jgi:hypothetical protein